MFGEIKTYALPLCRYKVETFLKPNKTSMSKFNVNISIEADSVDELKENLSVFGLTPEGLTVTKASVTSKIDKAEAPSKKAVEEDPEEEEDKPAAKKTRTRAIKEEKPAAKKKAVEEDPDDEEEESAAPKKIMLEHLRELAEKMYDADKDDQLDKILRKFDAVDEDTDRTKLSLLSKDKYQAVYDAMLAKLK